MISRSEMKPLIMPDEPEPSGRRRRDTILTVMVVVIVLLGGGGTAAWIVLHRAPGRATLPAIHASTGSPSSDGPAGATSPGVGSPRDLSPSTGSSDAGSGSASPGQVTPSPSAEPGSTAPGTDSTRLVRLGSSAVGDPRAPGVLAFTKMYFAAINDHSFRRYRDLLSVSLRDAQTKAEFEQDFGSSADSGATIVRIFTSGAGATGTSISFTSHQKPSQSATGTESCTKWIITLYLDDGSGHYLIGQAPPSYSPVDHAC
jgi:hypothetical protein